MTLILVRLLTTLLIFALLLLPMAAWHWTLVGVPFPLASEAVPLADRNLASQLPVLYALIAAYAAWLHTPFWSVWPLRICALIGAAGLVTQAVRRREMRASALPPLLCLLLPALCALGMPYTGASTARLLFRAVDPLAVLLAVAAVCQLPDWLNAVLRYRYLVLPQKWFVPLRVVAGLVLAGSAVYGSRQWNRGWLAQVRERQAIHGTLQRLFQTGRPATPPPVVLTDQPGWILWETGVRALDLNGDLTPRFLHCRDRQGRLDAGRLQALLRESPAQYLLLWHLNFEGKGQNSLPLRRLHFPGDYVSILPPRLYAFRDSAGE